ncbi:MAG TPA: LppX_LprAFG lipoprotein [Pseudonocardiaceae bacterium]|jgi:lipoprotein LprG|nr:LppX_LprAFG lipoprotein [Pseudonocardiaceae bacterium]
MRNRRVGALAVLAFLLVLVSGCQSGSDSSNLPAAPGLLSTAAASTRAVTSLHFTLAVNGTLTSVPVQSAEGDLNAQGQARGNAKISELGQLIQVDFVLVDGSFYLKGLTGGYQKLPSSMATSVFDPTAILDPNRGVAKVLGGLGGPKTQAQEEVDGQQTYRISGTVAKSVVAGLIPGISSDVATQVWVTTDARHLPVRAQFTVPGADGSQGATVDVHISKINQPVTVAAPN